MYLTFPTLGIFELIPDAVPVFGSMDEAAATVLLINTLNYYGLDLSRLYGRSSGQERRRKRRLRESPPGEDEG